MRPVYLSGKELMPSGAGDFKVSTSMCTACKSVDSAAVANCFSCAKLLCANCVIAHQLMVAFEVSILAEVIIQ